MNDEYRKLIGKRVSIYKRKLGIEKKKGKRKR